MATPSPPSRHLPEVLLLKQRIAARTSWKRAVRQNLGLKAPRSMGWITNPKRAAYNRVYNRTTFGVGRGGGGAALGCLALLFVVGGAVVSVAEAHVEDLIMGGVVVFCLVAAGVSTVSGKNAKARAARHASLVQRFGEQVAEAIMADRIWEGATHEIVVESLGPPVEVKERVLKTKNKTTLCYQPVGKGRYHMKVELDDGVVVKWTPEE